MNSVEQSECIERLEKEVRTLQGVIRSVVTWSQDVDARLESLESHVLDLKFEQIERMK